MADMEKAKGQPESPGLTNFSYVLSFAGILRLLNLVLGAVSLTLWIPGYEHSFLGEKINPNGDTSKGYGNGFKRETLNQFVLASIVICLLVSLIFIFGLALISRAAVDWNRFNKIAHLGLGIMTSISVICAACGTWYFQEGCCNVDMFFGGSSGVSFALNSDEGYVRHCNCYLTRITGSSETETVTDTILWEATRNPDKSGFSDQWVFAAHHVYPHVAAVFVLLVNAVVYFFAAVVSKPPKSSTIIQPQPPPPT